MVFFTFVFLGVGKVDFFVLIIYFIPRLVGKLCPHVWANSSNGCELYGYCLAHQVAFYLIIPSTCRLYCPIAQYGNRCFVY